MVMNSALLGSLAALALAAVAPAHAQSFTGDGTAYTLGAVSQGNCNFMASAADAATNYAAINQAQWDNLKNCGRCAQVSCVDDACPDKSVSEIVHIVDRCPECKQGDLDLSPTVFKKITGSSPSRLKISWKFVDCPNPGKLQYCLKSGSNPYFVAIQPANAGSGIASMKINGQSTTMVDSAFYYVLQSTAPVDLSAVKVSLTSTSGATVDETVSLSVGSCTAGKSQFGGSSGTPPATTPKATPAPAATPKATPTPTTTPKTTPKPATTPKATPTPTTKTPKPTTKTPKPTKTPKATKNSDVAGESTEAPAQATTAPVPSSDEYDDASSGSASAAPMTGAPTTEAPASSGEGASESPAYDDETPAPASDDEYGSSSASAEPMTPAPASDDEYSGSTSAAPAASASSSGDAPAPSAAEGSGAVATPTETPVVTPKKTTKPSNCKVRGGGSSKTKKTKAEKKAAKDAKKAAKAAKKAAKTAKKQQSKSGKKTSSGASTQSESANSTASSY
ncbi:Expansin protein 5, partial [Globisporangium splendens]